MARLGDVIEQIRGVSYKPSDLHDNLSDNSVILLRANNIQNGKIVLDDVIYVSKSKVSESQYLRRGDILVCTSSGSKELVGKAAFVDEDLPMVFGAFCKVVRPKIECCKYMGHFFQSPYYRNHISAASAGANINNLRNEHIADLSIPLPSLDEQRKIAAVLDKVSDLIAKRRQQLDKLDELVKARFVEMFGHQSHNEKSLPYMTINDVAEIYLGITHTPTYVENGVMFISAKNTSGDFLNLSDAKYISREEFESAPRGSKPKVNDVLFSRVGSNLGHPVILEEDLELCIFVSLGFLRTKGKVTSNYLKHWMRDDFFAHQVSEHVKGGGQPNLNTGWLKEFKIIVPDLEQQKEFDEYCNRVAKSKLTIQKSLDKLETLKKALMQEYFG